MFGIWRSVDIVKKLYGMHVCMMSIITSSFLTQTAARFAPRQNRFTVLCTDMRAERRGAAAVTVVSERVLLSPLPLCPLLLPCALDLTFDTK